MDIRTRPPLAVLAASAAMVALVLVVTAGGVVWLVGGGGAEVVPAHEVELGAVRVVAPGLAEVAGTTDAPDGTPLRVRFLRTGRTPLAGEARARAGRFATLVGGLSDGVSGYRVEASGADVARVARNVSLDGSKLGRRLPDPVRFADGSAEQTLAGFLSAWREHDFARMAGHADDAWRSRQADPAGWLANAFGALELLSADIVESDGTDIVTRIVYLMGGLPRAEHVRAEMSRGPQGWGVRSLTTPTP